MGTSGSRAEPGSVLGDHASHLGQGTSSQPGNAASGVSYCWSASVSWHRHSLLHLLNLVSAGDMGQGGMSGEGCALKDLWLSVGKLPVKLKWLKKPKKIPLRLTPKVTCKVSSEFTPDFTRHILP